MAAALPAAASASAPVAVRADAAWLSLAALSLALAMLSAALHWRRRHAQDALARDVGLLENTLASMDQGIAILDPALRVLRANRRLLDLLDLPESVCAAGTPFADVIRFNALRGDYGPGDAQSQVDDRLRPFLRREVHHFVRERPNGTVLDGRAAPLASGGYVITYTDVTARTRSEREAMRFRAALDLSDDGIFLADARTATILDCNAGACAALGYTREELVGHGAEIIFADRTHEDLRAQYARLAEADDGGAAFSAHQRRRDGSTFPVEVHRRVFHTPQGPLILGVARDVTAQRAGEAALRRSEATLRAVVENALDAVVRIDAEGRVVGWNAQAERSFGWSAAEAMGRDLAGLIVPERHREAHTRGMRHFLATGHGPVLNRRVEMGALRRDGHEIPVELTVTPIATADGWSFSAFLRDLTAVRAGEAARAALEARLRESQKMEAIGTLAGGIAHDFNNILAAILGHAELARQDLGPGVAARRDLEQIQKSAQRARSLVQQILTFGRRQEQTLQPVALQPLLDEVQAMMRALLPAGVSLHAVPADEPLWAMADATQLHQVLMNLCTNAWHALQGRPGEIQIGLAAADGGAGGRQAHLWVRDSGCGMDAETRARIFEPFFTTKAVGRGTGLGLAVAHGIVASHQGRIAVESAPGQGSCFHVHLPLCAPPEASEHGALAPAGAAGPGRGEHVLYIDDDEAMVALVERVLQRAGYRVTASADAAAALALLRAGPQAFDIVVTDFNMPELSGFDVAREAARLRRDLPVVVSSGYITEAMRGDAQAAGVRALLRKENTIEELGSLVRAVLAQSAAAAAAAR